MTTCYSHLLDPTLYPDYTRRPARPPTWRSFEDRMQFGVLPEFQEENGKLLPGWREKLILMTERLGLGRVIGPRINTVLTENARDLVNEVKNRGLFLLNFWGYIPGSEPGITWGHYVLKREWLDQFIEELGDRFMGVNNGEQDGRYVGGYAHQQCPSGADRFRQYLNFHRHFERLCDDLGNHMDALVSLCFGHYFLKEGNHVLIGAETAQGLPNCQVYYAFIRGAGKQYGVHWYGGVSIFNRWGYKSYDSPESVDGEEGYKCGPEEGTSLNLLKRLMYIHYLYNCVTVGFEWSMIQKADGGELPDGEKPALVLSPIGAIQARAAEFVERFPQPGVMHTPVAILLDFFTGWAPPRHLYSLNVFQVWGSMPYEPGDYLTHGVLSMLYPGYVDSGFYRDERGFLTPTPYGDIADCLLSDAPLWVLGQYDLVIATGQLRMSAELSDMLRCYVCAGGHVVVTGANASDLVPGLRVGPEARHFPAGATVRLLDAPGSDGGVVEAHAFSLLECTIPEHARVLAEAEGIPAVVRIDDGRGAWTILLSPFGLNNEPLVAGRIVNEVEKPIECPFVLLDHVRLIIDEALVARQLFSVPEGLGLITCRKGKGEYTLGVHNNDVYARPFSITSRCGPIRSIVELPLDRSERGQKGYWPRHLAGNDGGMSDTRTIAGGDIRLFAVTVEEMGVRSLPRISPPERPRNRMLALRSNDSIKDQILARPTFFHYFDGVKVDWTHLRQRDASELRACAGWLNRQQVRVVVDFSVGLNFYPDLTLLDTLMWRYRESMAAIGEVLAKMDLISSRDMIVSLHRKPEDYCDDARADERFLAGARELCRLAAEKGITVHLQHHPHKWHGTAARMLDFIARVDAGNLRFALNTGHAAMTEENLSELLAVAADRLGVVLLCAPKRDLLGQIYDAHTPVNASGLDLSPLRACSHVPQILDVDYLDESTEYLDCLEAWGDGRMLP